MVPVLLSALLTLGLVALFYALALRLAGRRFQRVVFGVQIAVTVMLMGGVQAVMPLLHGSHLGQLYTEHPALRWLLVPPPHFGGLFLAGPGRGDLATDGSRRRRWSSRWRWWPSVLVAGRHFVAGVAGTLVPQAERGALASGAAGCTPHALARGAPPSTSCWPSRAATGSSCGRRCRD